MNDKELFEDVAYRIKDEGFHYCFNGYSSWTNIKDEEFHKLRNQYLESIEKLKNYINEKTKETQN